MDSIAELRALRKELHKLNAEYRLASLYRDTARQDSLWAYYTNKMEQLDNRIALLTERIGVLV